MELDDMIMKIIDGRVGISSNLEEGQTNRYKLTSDNKKLGHHYIGKQSPSSLVHRTDSDSFPDITSKTTTTTTSIEDSPANYRNHSSIKIVTCVINRRLRQHQHLFDYYHSQPSNRSTTSKSLLMTTKMNPIMFIKSSVLLTMVIVSLVIVTSLVLAAPPQVGAEVRSNDQTSSHEVLESPKIAVETLSSPKALVEKISPNVSSGSVSKESETSFDASPRQSRAVDSSTTSSSVNRADSSPTQKTTTSNTSSKKALDSPSESVGAISAGPLSSSSSPTNESKSSGGKATSSTSKAASNKSASSKSNGSSSSNGANPGHYISKHDSYSAIAERHILTDVMRKSDRRRSQPSSMEHSSKLGDMFSSLKDVTNNGFSRSLGASVRSILKSKYSVPAYVASALLGAVALMAFYESPISPLPVPALPEPPIGRFPPEMPSLPVGTMVPFRYNNNNAYQRSFQQQQQQQQPTAGGKAPIFNGIPQSYQANDRVSFPGQTATNNNNQQQPVAQRKSSLEYDPVSSRSLFGSSVNSNAGKTSTNTLNNRIGVVGGGQQPQQQDYFGSASGENSPMIMGMNFVSQQFGGSSESKLASSSPSSAVLSNSHLINKFKSYFSRSSSISPASSSSTSSSVNQMKSPNPYEQYQRMSLIQALIKDTSFLPAFLTGDANKKANSSPSSAASPSNGKQKAGQSGGNALTERMITTSSNNNQNANAQFNYSPDSLGQQSLSPSKQQQQQQQQQQTSPSSSGIMKAADKIAHALLETLTTGLQRHSTSSYSPSSPSSSSTGSSSTGSSSSSSSGSSSAKSLNGNQQDQISSRKSGDLDLSPNLETSSSSLANTASSKTILSDSTITSSASSSSSSKSDNIGVDHHSQPVASGRSRDDDTQQIVKHTQPQSSELHKQPMASAPSSASASPSLNRKTRSVDQQLEAQQKPSTAANINNVIDYVSDNYSQNRLLFTTILNHVGLGRATQYMDNFIMGSSNVH